MDGIAEKDGLMELPLQDRQERDGIQAGCLTHQAGSDRQAEESMGDGPAEWTAFRRMMIDMNGVEIPGNPREQDDIRLSYRPSRALPLVADDQIVERQG
jgi:hypothetical protein